MKRCLGCNEPSGELYGKLCPRCRGAKVRRKKREMYVQKKHGMTLEQFEERTKACHVCSKPALRFKSGIFCRRCASGLNFLNTVELLEQALKYVRMKTKRPAHKGGQVHRAQS